MSRPMTSYPAGAVAAMQQPGSMNNNTVDVVNDVHDNVIMTTGQPNCGHGGTGKGAKVIAAIAAILLLTMFIWLLIYSMRWSWFMKGQHVDTTKAFLVSVGLAIVIVVIIAIIMYFAGRK